MKKPSPIDKDGNEITFEEKVIAGILLVLFTAFSIIVIIAYWPDRLPSPKDDIKPLYTTEWFHVRLAGVPDSNVTVAARPATDTAGKHAIVDTSKHKDSTGKPVIDSQGIKNNTSGDSSSHTKNIGGSIDEDKFIHLNTLLLLLVATAGFLGNLIHIGTSFTTYIGAGQFRRSWILWYCVKPFTAAALAMGIYFVFCTGLLNMGPGGGYVNLYGIMTISLLAGLFTDRTTLKLKEVFDVLLRPKEERPNTLEVNLKISGISPDTLEKDKENIIIISGENLDKKKFTITINDEVVSVADLKTVSATVKYTIPETQKDKNEFILVIKNEQNEVIGTYSLKLAGTGNDGSGDEPVG